MIVRFEHQQALHDRNLVDYATEIGLDVFLFIREMTAHRYADRLREDFLSGVRSGVKRHADLFHQRCTLPRLLESPLLIGRHRTGGRRSVGLIDPDDRSAVRAALSTDRRLK
jgi:hypothetical protein